MAKSFRYDCLSFRLTNVYPQIPDLKLAIALSSFLDRRGAFVDLFFLSFGLKAVQSVCNYYLYYDFGLRVGYYLFICHL
jgi:hypothetical protein